MPDLPAWARWNAPGPEHRWTVGIEEEAVLLDAQTWSVANRIGDVLVALTPELASHAAAETHACVIELRTSPHTSVRSAVAELVGVRQSLDQAVRRLGLRAGAAGTHPMAVRSEVGVSPTPRHREISATMRALAYREPTMALHVHVAVPDGAAAIRALDGLRRDLPVLLALSGNSPYWRGEDSGFASVRTPIFSMFPRSGIPSHFGTFDAYVHALDPLLSSGAIPEPGFLWWDARPQPRLGTVEVRVMDAQTQAIDTAALAALIQCLIMRHASGAGTQAVAAEIVSENRFLAARDGMRARLIDERTQRTQPVRDVLAALVDSCAGAADELGCASELAAVETLADDPGDARQRAHAGMHGIASVPGLLADEFALAAYGQAVA